MKLVFFGSGRFAVPTLEALAPWVSLVVTQPDRPSGRGMKSRSNPVKQSAMDLGLTVESPEKCRNPEFIERIRAEKADALVVAAYGQILPVALLEATKQGGINLHGSLLPKYRGAAPIQRCILEGEMETGVTLMQMDKGMDTGDIIAIQTLQIDPDETYGELETRLAVTAADMAKEWMPRIADGDYPRSAQEDSYATTAPKVEKQEAELDPSRPAEAEYNRYRAFTPSPGAFLRSNWGLLKIARARLSPGAGEGGVMPGTILEAKTSLVIAFQGGAIELVELQPEGKKRMSGRDFANGVRLVPGMPLRDEL